MARPPLNPVKKRPLTVAGALLAATGLMLLFWWPLCLGAGLVGGDLYPYYFPQKAFLSDCLQAGEFPLWNSLVGHGYPLIAESQTASLHPIVLACFASLGLNDAYNAVQLIHYVLAFVGMALFVRRWLGAGASWAGPLFAATVFTYSWFPPRICLEWAILTGAYLPWLLWSIESYLQTRRVRYLLLTTLLVGVQLLAGHFHLAFLTALVAGPYLLFREWPAVRQVFEGALPVRTRLSLAIKTGVVALVVAIFCGYLLAAVQLIPTWELKSQSQRADLNREHDPAYGHIPPVYLTQIIAPWFWYDPTLDRDALLGRLTWGAAAAGTNQVEAHLYFGLIPLALAVWVCCLPGDRRAERWFWLGLAVFGMVFATGCLLPVFEHLPGFGFFHGPGRYGLLATVAVSLASAIGIERIGNWNRFAAGRWLPIVCLAVTLGDLGIVSQIVTYAIPVPNPPIAARSESPVRRLLLQEPLPARLFAPGPNLPTILRVSAVPVYLGIGPAAYFSEEGRFPENAAKPVAGDPYSTEQIAWMRTQGVTHLLTFERLDPQQLPVDEIWIGFDPLLSRAWARFDEPLYLYALQDSLPRVRLAEPERALTVHESRWSANRVFLDVESPLGGTCVLGDLAYPGWVCRIDGKIVPAFPAGIDRAVSLAAGRHQVDWVYTPQSLYWGGIVSWLGLLGTAFWAFFLRKEALKLR